MSSEHKIGKEKAVEIANSVLNYSGSVFTAGPYDFSVSKYFAVKRSNQSDLNL